VSDVQRGGAAEGGGGRPRDRRAACGAVPELLALSRRLSRRRFGRTATAAKRAARRCGKPLLVARRREERGHAVHKHERLIVLGDVLVAVRAHAALTSFRDELATAAIRSATFVREPALWPRARARSQQRSRKVQCGAAQQHAGPSNRSRTGRRARPTAQTPAAFPGKRSRKPGDQRGWQATEGGRRAKARGGR